MLFLKDYDLIWRVEQGVNMGLADGLSRKDNVNTDNVNHMVTLLPQDNIHHQQIHQLDLDLAQKISKSSAMDPVVIKAHTGMINENRDSWLP